MPSLPGGVAAGGAPMSWPTIAQVNTAATNCTNAENAQSIAKGSYDLAQESVSELRPTVDAVIKDLWDTIEFNLRADAPPAPPTPPPAP
jgi:hypothetical protein